MRRRLTGCLAAAMAVLFMSEGSCADPIADFYKDKRLTVIVGYPAGGGFDAYARLVGDNIGRHIPGVPRAVIQYMPGAATLKSVSYIYNVAPRDGTVIGIPSTYLVFNAFVRGEVGDNVDVTRLNWIGRLAPMDIVTVVWNSVGVRNFADLKAKKVFFGGTSATGGSAIVPQVLNRMFNTKIELALGYRGTTAQYLAMEGGEIQGMSNAIWSQLKRSHPQWIEERKVVPIIQDGFERRPGLTDVPTMPELATNDEDRKVLRLISSASVFGRSFYGGPDLPRERVAALRKAFMDMVKDADFLAKARKLNIDIDALSGNDLQVMTREISAYPKVLFERTKVLTEVKRQQKKGKK